MYSYKKGYDAGYAKADAIFQRYKRDAEEKYRILQEKKDKIKEVIVTKYVDKIVYITKWRSTNVQIADLVPDTAVLSSGWMHVHDASAEGRNADPAVAVDETPSEVTAAEALQTVTENYATYHEVSEQLKLLQEWVTENIKAVNDVNNNKNGTNDGQLIGKQGK